MSDPPELSVPWVVEKTTPAPERGCPDESKTVAMILVGCPGETTGGFAVTEMEEGDEGGVEVSSATVTVTVAGVILPLVAVTVAVSDVCSTS